MKKMLFIIIPLLLSTNIFASQHKDDLSSSEAAQIFQDTLDRIDNEYIGDYTNRDLLDNALYGMTYNLDPYSFYLSQDYIEKNYSVTEISYAMGIDLVENNGKYYVTHITENSPITLFDVQVGDEVIALNQFHISDLTHDKIDDILYTYPAHIKSIKLVRGDKILSYDLAFNFIQTVFCTEEDNNVILNIKEFQNTTPYEIKEVLDDIDHPEEKNLIIDIRDNGGGYVLSLNKVLNMFVPEQETFSIVYKDGTKDVFHSDGQDYCFNKIIVLVNENTASCAEVFAGVMQEYGLATIIGSTTYGKGVSQDINPISVDGIDYTGAIKMTTGLIFINGRSFNKIGITPDIEVNLPKFIMTDSDYYYESLHTTFDDNLSLLLTLGGYSSLSDFKKDHGLPEDNILDQETIDALNLFNDELQSENDFVMMAAFEQCKNSKL